MPSFLDLLQSSSGGDDAPRPTSDGVVPLDVLATVKHEGGRRRRRRQRRNLAVGGVALVAVAVPAFALVGGGGGDSAEEVRSAELADAPSSTTAERERPVASTTSTTVDPTEVLGVTIERTPEEEAAGSTATSTPTTARPSRPVTTAPPATQPPLVCENSVDPACGPFRWSPDPGNAPASLTTAEVLELTVGQSTTITAAWSDPDAGLRFDDFSTDGTQIAGACTYDRRYGPWSPPAPSPGSGQLSYAYTAPSTPGTYLLAISIGTGNCQEPYASDAQRLITVNVVEAPAP